MLHCCVGIDLHVHDVQLCKNATDFQEEVHLKCFLVLKDLLLLTTFIVDVSDFYFSFCHCLEQKKNMTLTICKCHCLIMNRRGILNRFAA